MSTRQIFSKAITDHKIFAVTLVTLSGIIVADQIITESEFDNNILLAGTYAVFFLAILRIRHESFAGNHARAWICFTVFAGFIAGGELIRTLGNCTEFDKQVCAISEIASLLAYIPFILFVGLFLRPFFGSISKKIIIISTIIAISTSIPTIVYELDHEHSDQITALINHTNEVFDTILLSMAVIGIFLFNSGKIRLPWFIIFTGILFTELVDFTFMFVDKSSTHYSIDNELFIIGYALFCLGVYYNSKNLPHSKDRFHNQESLK